MSTNDLVTVLIKYIGLSAIFWAAQGLIIAQVTNSPLSARGDSLTGAVTRIVMGAAVIFLAPYIASIVDPKPTE